MLRHRKVVHHSRATGFQRQRFYQLTCGISLMVCQIGLENVVSEEMHHAGLRVNLRMCGHGCLELATVIESLFC